MTDLPHHDTQTNQPPSLEEITAKAKPGVGAMFTKLLAHRTSEAFGWGFEAHRDLAKRAWDEYEAGLISFAELKTYCTTGSATAKEV